jgi:chromosome segregation ATPase
MKTIRPGFALPHALLFFFLVLTPAVRMAAADPAVATLRTKAEAGNSSAQYYLGLTYAEGRAVPKDPVEAYVWLSLAAENGSTGKALGVLVAEMTPDQLAAGRVRLEARRRTTPGVISLPRIGPPAAPAENDSGTVGQEAGIVPVDQSNLSDELAAAWKEADGAKAAATAAEQRARQAEAGLNQRAKDLIALQTERDQLRRQLAAAPAAAAVDALQQDRNKLASRLAIANTDMQSLRERMANLEAEDDRLQQAATGTAQAAASLAAMQRDRDEQARSLTAAQTAATELTAQLKMLGEEKAALVQANARLEEQARTSARQAGDEASARAVQARRALETTLADQTQKLAALTTELAATRQNLAAAEAGQAQMTKLAAETAAARKELLAVQSTNADLNTQVKKQTEDRESIDRQLAAANQKLEEQARLAAQVTADRAAAVAKAEEQTRALDAKIAERDGQLAAAQTDQAQATKLAAAFSAARKELAAVQSANADFAVKLKKLTDENAVLSQQASPEVASLKTRLGQAESDLNTARARNVELVADSQKLEDQIHAADVPSEETTRTKTALASAEQRARQAETTLGQRDRELAVLQADLENTRRAVKDLDAAQAAITQAAATAEQNRRERDDLRQQLEATRKESAVARNSGTELAAQLKKQTEDNAALNRQLADRGDAATRLASVTGQLDDTRKELAALKNSQAELNESIRHLTEERGRWQTQIAAADTAKAEAARLQAEVAALTRQGDAARKDLTSSQTVAASRAGENTRQLAELNDQLQQAKQELAELRTQNQSLQEASQRLERQGKGNTDIARQLANAQTAIDQLKHENAGLQAERTVLTARLAQTASAAATTTVATVASPDSADEVARLKEELGRAEARVEMTVRSFALAQQENERLKAQLEQAGPSAPQAHNAEAMPAITQQEPAAVRADAIKAAAETASLRDSLRQLQNSNASLAAENARLRTTMAMAGGNLPAGSRAQPGRPAAVTAAVTPPTAPVASASPPAPAPRIHRVVSGDTLTRISSRYYGTPSRWQEIYNANRDQLSSADALPLDVELKIP